MLSDSHGELNNMVKAVKREKPDMIFHLGDCWSDSTSLKKKFPDIKMVRVAGNCDYEDAYLEHIVDIEGKSIMICHGHSYNVKAGYLTIQMAAIEKQVDAVLFGHTHRVFYDLHEGLWIANPGSIGAPPRNIPPSYGILEVDGESGYIHINIEYIE